MASQALRGRAGRDGQIPDISGGKRDLGVLTNRKLSLREGGETRKSPRCLPPGWSGLLPRGRGEGCVPTSHSPLPLALSQPLNWPPYDCARRTTYPDSLTPPNSSDLHATKPKCQEIKLLVEGHTVAGGKGPSWDFSWHSVAPEPTLITTRLHGLSRRLTWLTGLCWHRLTQQFRF